MKKLVWTSAALIAVLALSILSSGAGPAPRASAAGTITFVGIDTVTTGNTASAINGHAAGSVVISSDVQTCVSVNNGDTFTIDLVMDSLPAAQKLAGVTYDIDYDGAIVQLGNDDDNDGKFDEDTLFGDGDQDGDATDGEEGPDGPDPSATIGHNPNFVLSGPLDFTKGNGNDTTSWSDYFSSFGQLSGLPTGPRSGVLDRVTIKAVGAGLATLNLRNFYGSGFPNSSPELLDNFSNAFTISNGGGGDATIAVGQACPALVLVQGNVDCSSTGTEPNAVDALKVLRKVAGLSVTKADPNCPDIGTGPSPVWGNVDCSVAVPEVSAVDALKILRKVAGLLVGQTEPCVNLGDPFP